MFQVQLVLGKFVLPRFGGGPAIWSTSVFVFQLLLLAGYGYAALICAKLQPKLQGKLHLVLLAASAAVIVVLAFLWHSPILPQRIWQIATLLITAVGFQCVLLSATSPLLQKWISHRDPRATPYRLYALSNLGSMLGLLTYPFLVERFLTLPAQSWLWTSLYAIFAIGAGACAYLQMRHPGAALEITHRKPKKSAAPDLQTRFLWLALAACASAMLLATTNLIYSSKLR